MQQLPDHSPALSVLNSTVGYEGRLPVVLVRRVRTVDYMLPRLEHSLLLLTWYRVASPATYDVQLQMGHLAVWTSFAGA